MWWRSLCIASSALMMTACGSSPTTSTPATLSADLAQRCPSLPKPAGNSRKDHLLWSRDVIRLYDQCARRHDETVLAWPK